MSKMEGFKQKYFSLVRAKTDFFIFRSWTIKSLQAYFASALEVKTNMIQLEL